jgi:hypothetical protein
MLGDIIKNKLIAAVGLALLTAVAPGVAAAQSVPADHTRPSLPATSRSDGPVGGYEGWWNATPTTGDTAALPQETVAVNTETHKLVDAFNRAINDAGRSTELTDVNYTVEPDPGWPDHSVVIIDTATNRVIADFRVDERGEPIR